MTQAPAKLAPIPAPAAPGEAPLCVDLDAVGIADIASVGGKNASLGELRRHLSPIGIRVPDGFALTAAAYRTLVAQGDLAPGVRGAIDGLRGGVPLAETGAAIREMFLETPLPPLVEQAVRHGYRDLCERLGGEIAVAVRSSATAEDLPDASFAGQQESFLNIRGETALLDACRRCYASLFTDRAIAYREAKGFDHLSVALSIGVQQMVRSDKAGAGIIFTLDTETGFPNLVAISAAWGLGEPIVKGSVDPDQHLVFKPLLDRADRLPIIGRKLGAKRIRMRYGHGGEPATRTVATRITERQTFVLDDLEVLTLARWAVAVEAHYGRPMDLEWAKDGETGDLFLVQARPETVHSGRNKTILRSWRLMGKGEVIASGAAVGQAIASGPVCRVLDARALAAFPEGAVLVTERTDPDWVPAMRRASGIVTDHGGPTSHAAIVSRELGVPAIVGAGNATRLLTDGQKVTLSCASGARGELLDGAIPFTSESVDLSGLPKIGTELLVNLADPDAALAWWQLPAAGVGLARMEFVVSNHVGVHPMALADPTRVSSPAARQRIARLTRGYADPRDYFVDRLALGIARIAAVFYPRPAIVRLSDFKTNEYARLLGGTDFEPPEENPMLGFRGAARYYSDRYRDGFALECRALKRVREEIGLDNVIVMVPFCRTPGEADRVLAEMAANGLQRGAAGLKVYMMAEIPSNILRAEEFAQRFDGFSIGSNDLTQLVLGIDRDSDLLAPLFDERDPAVEGLIAELIQRAHACHAKVGICGQGPSDHGDFARFLVEQHIDSISLNPDSFVATLRRLAALERAP